MKKLALLFLVLPAAACAPATYQRANTTQWEFGADQTACEDYAKALPPAVDANNNHVLGGPSPRAEMRNCMVTKGYRIASR
jgi:hypothetical protein